VVRLDLKKVREAREPINQHGERERMKNKCTDLQKFAGRSAGAQSVQNAPQCDGLLAACNRFHVVTQRMARWLLMTRDRVNSNEFLITQSFLALMLGVRRPRVTLAMRSLRERNLIVYRRGTITFLDQGGLVAAACGCYKTVKDAYTQAQAQKGISRPALQK
jgi:hypothetical protein